MRDFWVGWGSFYYPILSATIAAAPSAGAGSATTVVQTAISGSNFVMIGVAATDTDRGVVFQRNTSCYGVWRATCITVRLACTPLFSALLSSALLLIHGITANSVLLELPVPTWLC